MANSETSDDQDSPRESDGRYSREYDDKVFVEAVAEIGSAETPRIAEAVGCTTQTARSRLRKLVKEW